jgi:endonuclease/exonuclease/phosphatase (EEP) superfamily protein YafD
MGLLRTLSKFLLTVAVLPLAIFVSVALALKVTLGDLFFWTRWFFYLPSPIYLVFGVVLVLLCRSLSRTLRGAWLAFIIGLCGWAFYQEHPAMFTTQLLPGRVVGAPLLRVMTWNVQAYKGGEAEVVRFIGEARPDVLVLVEGTFQNRKPEKLARGLGSSYEWAVQKRLSVASRYPIVQHSLGQEGNGLLTMEVVLDVSGERVTVTAVDVSPPRRRVDSDVFRRLFSVIQSVEGRSIVAGDFNTPRGSRWLSIAMGSYRDDLLATCESRWLATWPSRAPMLPLDYTFSRGKIRPVESELLSSTVSDHLPLMTRYLLDQ